jgi:hypothetical protein
MHLLTAQWKNWISDSAEIWLELTVDYVRLSSFSKVVLIHFIVTLILQLHVLRKVSQTAANAVSTPVILSTYLVLTVTVTLTASQLVNPLLPLL